MINIETLLKIKEKNELTIEATIWLWLIEEGSYHLMEGYNPCLITSLIISGYVNSGDEITEKGRAYLKSIVGGKSVKIEYGAIHKALQDKMIALTGKRQREGFGGVYFIPTLKELEEFLTRFWKNYPQYKEITKITKILESHIEKCVKKGNFSPAIKYFIYKQGVGSQLAGAWENYEEQEVELQSDGINI